MSALGYRPSCRWRRQRGRTRRSSGGDHRIGCDRDGYHRVRTLPFIVSKVLPPFLAGCASGSAAAEPKASLREGPAGPVGRCAATAQTFFCIAVAIAKFTGRQWVEESPRPVADNGHPALLVLCFYSIFILYVQLILGAMFRHRGMPWWPHVLNAISVTAILAWTGVRAMRFREIPAVRRLGMLVHSLLLVQILLGFASFYTRVVLGADAAQPELPMIVSTVAHVAVGALLLATTAVLTIQVWRHVTVRQTHAAVEGTRITA